MITGHITRNKLILALVSVARSPDATDANKNDAKNMILLLIGAADYFFDKTGARIMRIEEAIREKTCELGVDHPDVIRMRVERDHQNFIEDLVEGRGYELH
ncbi:hypothetical protein B0G69_1186 [Paraburkholderia sp. RAU2J]|uniref:hypothetical protein n=1 Tax=Paraburkholderia sp. RAU2J TaxID=1938810 RepID=UPI000EB3444A|nr:hypothetical protein [Paraburkholderia sp. RAU2J]RKT25470.1 hypothetical protein B0G69_1186 [Paraburkholderia sp. RAU2J]